MGVSEKDHRAPEAHLSERAHKIGAPDCWGPLVSEGVKANHLP